MIGGVFYEPQNALTPEHPRKPGGLILFAVQGAGISTLVAALHGVLKPARASSSMRKTHREQYHKHLHDCDDGILVVGGDQLIFPAISAIC